VRGWSCFLAICLAWTLHGRAAQPQLESTTLDLRVTAQPLDEALQEFSRQSGLQVIYFSGLTEGLQSPGVSGRYTLAAALKALLAGSGLSFRLVNDRTVEIRSAGRTRGEGGQ